MRRRRHEDAERRSKRGERIAEDRRHLGGIALEPLGRPLAAREDRPAVDAVARAAGLRGNPRDPRERIARALHAREHFRVIEGKIDALTAQGKLQGWVVSAMPLVLGMVLQYMRPDLMDPMLDHMFGYILVAAIMLMEIMGVLLIRRITNIDI
jgi:tight adherence protein B